MAITSNATNKNAHITLRFEWLNFYFNNTAKLNNVFDIYKYFDIYFNGYIMPE